jgi:hypothetical protein
LRVTSRGLGDVYKRQVNGVSNGNNWITKNFVSGSWNQNGATFAFSYKYSTYVYSNLYKLYYSVPYSDGSSNGFTGTTVETQTVTNVDTVSGSLVNGTTQNISTASAKKFSAICESVELGILVTVAADTANATGSAAYSTNGSAWTVVNTPTASLWFKVIWIAEIGLFVAISSDSTPAMMKSADGITWTSVSINGSITTLADMKWFPEISTLLLVSNVSASTYAITASYLTANSNLTLLANQQYSNVLTSYNANAMVAATLGLNSAQRWLVTDKNNASTEVMRVSGTGLSININQQSTAALDIMASRTKNNNKVLRLKPLSGPYAFDFTYDTSGNLSTSFSNSTTATFTMNNNLSVASSVNATNYGTGALQVTGGASISQTLYISQNLFVNTLATIGTLTTSTSEFKTRLGDDLSLIHI